MNRTIYECKVILSCQDGICYLLKVSEYTDHSLTPSLPLSSFLTAKESNKSIVLSCIFWKCYFPFSWKRHWTPATTLFTNKKISLAWIDSLISKQRHKAVRRCTLTANQVQLNLIRGGKDSLFLFLCRDSREAKIEQTPLLPSFVRFPQRFFCSCDIRL